MSKLYNGGASFGFSLNYNTAVPVDTRIVVKTITDLKDPQTWISGKYDAENDENNASESKDTKDTTSENNP